jgi:hypothetical protein
MLYIGTPPGIPILQPCRWSHLHSPLSVGHIHYIFIANSRQAWTQKQISYRLWIAIPVSGVARRQMARASNRTNAYETWRSGCALLVPLPYYCATARNVLQLARRIALIGPMACYRREDGTAPRQANATTDRSRTCQEGTRNHVPHERLVPIACECLGILHWGEFRHRIYSFYSLRENPELRYRFTKFYVAAASPLKLQGNQIVLKVIVLL